MNKEELKGISQLNLYRNFSKIDINIFKKAGLSNEDIEWIKKRIAKNPKGFLFDFKEFDKDNRLSNNYFVFNEENNLSINKKEKDNHLLIEGDNYEALLALKSTGVKVDVIYIDPPYNTGKEFIYSDNYSTNPKPVGNDDVHKHSKWLSFMKKRLILAKELLTNDGVIFISIDDNEEAYLKVLMDEIFGESNFVSSIPRITSPQRSGQEKYMNISHDYILTYSLGGDFRRITERTIKNEILQDKNGKYIKGDTKAILAAASQGYSEGGDYDFEYNGKIYSPVDSKGVRNRWLWVKERMQKAADLGILVETKNSLRMQLYLDVAFDTKTNEMIEKSDKLILHSKDFMVENNYSNPAGQSDISSQGIKFDTPKPVELIKKLIQLKLDNKDALVLDFFAGSGTTGQAVMELNREDDGNRKFILVTNNERTGVDTETNPQYGIARAITRERLFRLINGVGTNNEKIKWELPKALQNSKGKFLSENSVNYLMVNTIHKVNGEFEEIENIKKLYDNEFNVENFSIVELENG